ncbi:hypothetical protein KY285_026812 [Solanum tuberosum]|nr:hypothetical protein KY285_026812 [Solanum tuberosum]
MTSTSITNSVPNFPNPNFEIFDGKDFPRWRGKMEFFLRRLKLAYVLEKPCPDAPGSEVATNEATMIKEQIAKWQDDDYLCKNYILGEMSNTYYDQYYIKCKLAKEIWDTLKAIHLAEEATNKIAISGIALDENFDVGVIGSKLPPSWKEYRSKLLQKKEDLTLEQLLQHLQIEQETRYHDNNILKEPIMKAHVVEEKSIKKEPANNKFLKAKKSKIFKRSNSNSKSNECFHCHKIGHYARDCKILKAEKKKEKANNNTKNELVAMVTEAYVAGDQVEWWIDTGATRPI